jgi:secondary thiamine-phosphate synthase enzyme
MQTLQVNSRERTDFIDITRQVQAAVEAEGIADGVVTVFVPHTTAGITINENADPDVVHDMKTALDRLIPWSNGYRHAEGNSAAHLKSTLTGFSVQLPVSGGKLILGTWQGVYFCEFDGPRSRKVFVQP